MHMPSYIRISASSNCPSLSHITWHEYSEHDIITNRLLIRIISVAYTVL